jgi:hypothetical protein
LRRLCELFTESYFEGRAPVVGIGITEHPPAAGFPAGALTRDP